MPSRLSYVWLSQRRGLTPFNMAQLLRAFGSPDAVFAADRQALTAAPCDLRKAQVDALCDKDTAEAEEIIKHCARADIRIITLGDSAYPDRLRAIEDPPVVLYVRGRWPDFDVMPGIAVVGTREATAYGLSTAESIGAALGRAGFVTVSGMALGNDGAAHRGALRAGGLTVAVLAGGADVCYPPQHRSLMGDILLSGAIVSEYPPGTAPKGTHYHNRNRIISGLSVAAVIVEAGGYRSGALITARHALDQGRDVYAVPGSLNAPQIQSLQRTDRKGRGRTAAQPGGTRARIPRAAARKARAARPAGVCPSDRGAACPCRGKRMGGYPQTQGAGRTAPETDGRKGVCTVRGKGVPAAGGPARG